MVSGRYDLDECKLRQERMQKRKLRRIHGSVRRWRRHEVKNLRDGGTVCFVCFEGARPIGAAILEGSHSQYILERILRRV